MTLDIHVPAGSTGHGPLTVDIGADDAGWTYCGLRVAVLGAGEGLTLSTGDYELLVLPLADAAAVKTWSNVVYFYTLKNPPKLFQ